MKSEDSDTVTIVDFTNYVLAHEARLAEVFDQIDSNRDGTDSNAPALSQIW